ncbi:MAG TPA: glucoamylase family protein [Bryobacteraceae bacterium]|nr:glucoamylase family protein [Bryobacteraceae bacterium]
MTTQLAPQGIPISAPGAASPALHPPNRSPKLRRRAFQALFDRASALHRDPDAAAVLDNVRFLRSVEQLVPDFFRVEPRLPIDGGAGASACQSAIPRILALTRQYLDNAANRFEEEEFSAFLDDYQSQTVLTILELSHLQAALELELLDRLMAAEDPSAWPELVTSLQRAGKANWRDLIQSINRIDRVLAEDPSQIFERMDYESRASYRRVIQEIAARSSRGELEIARIAIRLSREALAASDGSRLARRRAHVGFYLLGAGRSRLEAEAGYQPSLSARFRRFLLSHPTGFYLISIELLTFALVLAMISGLDTLTPIFTGLVLLILPASQAAVDFVNSLVTSLLPARPLPKLDFSEGIPNDCVTMVAVPALLLNEEQVHDLALDLEIRFLANRHRNLYFALLTDSPDSDQPIDQRDHLVDILKALVEGLNARYSGDGRSPFFLLHRNRTYNEREGRWMGWERKRGKLLDLNRALRGHLQAFPVAVGDLSVLPSVRYVITLDADTQLPRDSAARMIGTMAHPLNQAVIDPQSRIVVDGYGILQPRVGISIQSASRSRLASLYSGQTGFDIYTRAVSDVYQDLFGEGSFCGKGIYEVDVLRETLDHRFPENALLSHDLIEGAYARAGLVSDIEVIDDYPSHFSSYNRRKHRWVRGDWQILRWLLGRVPDFTRQLVPNPISLLSQWKILDNLRRSLFEPSLLLLLLGSWLILPQSPVYWTVAAVAVLFLPAYARLFFALFRIPFEWRGVTAWVRVTAAAFLKENAMALFSLVFLLHQALVLIDAIVRSLARVFVTGRRLLEWETAAEAEAGLRPKATVDLYLEWTPWIALLIGFAVWSIRPAALPSAAPILFLWLISRFVSSWLNRRPRAAGCRVNAKDALLLRTAAERIYRFFRDWSSPTTSWLIPDSVRENGAVDLRISPTNAGLLLNARVAAVHLGLAPLSEFVFETRQTLDSLQALPKYRGHLFNWYSISTRQPIAPLFISTVDSGNLAAALWTLKQAALSFAAEPPARRGLTKELAAELKDIAEICERLVREMDFRCLYHRARRALSIGIDASTGHIAEACYDMLATEARIAAFIAIAKADVPQEVWFNLARPHTSLHGERVMISWTGTMFEYLMPMLWMRHYEGTITEQSVKSVVRIQREYARRKGVPWGISESACLGPTENEFGYMAFGLTSLAMRRSPDNLVVAPYATYLALPVDPAEAIENLRRMEEFGWTGRYGHFEAIEYTHTGGQPIRTWMAHHLGMSLLAIVNLLFDHPFQQYFHAEPQVMATELLLHERAPSAALDEPAIALPDFAPAEI